jgi:uncharacterized protein
VVELFLPLLVALSFVTATVGALGGIGGAVLLVPVLVLLGVDPFVAPPLGMLSVAAGSLAATPRQIETGLVHQRLGVTLEILASVGAIGGAVVANALDATLLARLLGVVAIGAALAGLGRQGLRNLPQPEFATDAPGEWPGTLGGAYRLGREVVPYQAKRLPGGMAAMLGAGIVSGLSGVGGGFIKTPVMRELMGVPVKVAAATSTFTVGITASAALIVFAGQGRIDYQAGAAVVVGGVVGGALGANMNDRLQPQQVRRTLVVLLFAIGVVLLVRA